MSFRRNEQRLRKAALAYPGAHEEFPWGERVIKVNGRIFLFLGTRQRGFACTTKLPESCEAALELPFTSPTGYGLGKSGWVTSRFPPDEDVPEELLLEWLEESYRAVAPRKLVEELDGDRAAPRPTRRARAVRKKQK